MTTSSGESARLDEVTEGVSTESVTIAEVGGHPPGSRPRRSGGEALHPLAFVGDLAIVGAVLMAWGLPPTTAVALFSAAVVASLVWGPSQPAVGTSPGDRALSAVGRVGLVLLAAIPVAVADGVAGSAAAAGGVTLTGIFGYRYLLASATHRRARVTRRAAIVGTGPLALEIVEYLLDHERESVQAVGMVDSRVRGDMPLPVLGEPHDLESIVAEHDIDVLVVAYGAFAECDLVPALRRCEELPVEVVVLPRFFELSLADLGQEMWGYPLARLGGSAEVRSSWRLKRLVDLVGAGALIVLSAPVLAAVATAVRLSSPGPILYKQERVGHRGRVFEMYKFRSMVENDDGDTTWTVEEDDRVTPVGRVIRATHLDELPQLFNVLRGDMSLVGPRPERPHFVDLFSDKFDSYAERHRVPAGMTGWSQVNGLWGDTSIEARCRLDNRYIESWSLRRDLLILAKTIPTLFKGRS